MLVIGITGGVGAGKSSILKALEEHCNCKIVLADDVGNKVKEPGQKCYLQVVELLGKDILNDDLTINRMKMAAKIFADAKMLEQVNEIIHPAVEEYILQEIENERKKQEIDVFFLEAALLIEAAEEEEDIVRNILEEEMKGAAGLAVTLEVDIHSGTDWYEAK